MLFAKHFGCRWTSQHLASGEVGICVEAENSACKATETVGNHGRPKTWPLPCNPIVRAFAGERLRPLASRIPKNQRKSTAESLRLKKS